MEWLSVLFQYASQVAPASTPETYIVSPCDEMVQKMVQGQKAVTEHLNFFLTNNHGPTSNIAYN